MKKKTKGVDTDILIDDAPYAQKLLSKMIMETYIILVLT